MGRREGEIDSWIRSVYLFSMYLSIYLSVNVGCTMVKVGLDILVIAH